MKKMDNDWKTDIKDWTSISKETAFLILSQSEMLLKEGVETAKSISIKAEKLVTIQIAAGTALFTYALNIVNTGKPYLFLTSILCLIVILISFYYSYKSFKKYEISVPGELPNVIATSKFIDTFKGDQQYLNMVLNIVENLQRRININIIANQKRTKYNVRSLKILLFIILCPLLAYLLWFLFPGMRF